MHGGSWGVLMRHSSRRLPVAVVVTGILALVLGACSGGALSISDYAVALDDATVAYTAESQALSATFHQTVEEEIAALAEAGEGDLMSLATGITSRETVQYLAFLEDAMRRYADALESMKPPAALTESHDGYIEAIDSVHSSMPETRERVGEAHYLD